MTRHHGFPLRLRHGRASPSTLLALVALASILSACADGKSAAGSAVVDDIPRLANGRPDFSGIWQSIGVADYGLEPHAARADAPPSAGVVEGHYIPYLPEALAQRQKNFENRATADPRLKCWVLGVPRSVYYPAPFQIFQRERDLTLLHQFGHQVRTIHTNGTKHPVAQDNGYWLGDSRGLWDGDTLVVDVVDFYDETWLDRSGHYHSTALHVVERWKLLDENTIEYRATIEDPNVFSRPWTIDVLLYRVRDKSFQLIENYCFTLPYEEHYPPRAPVQ